jgi:guanylate kinase
MSAPAPLVVVSGPSGVGKSTVVARALELDPRIWLSVSATTRRPRAGEVEGREYFFVSDAQFDALIADDGLLEWAAFAGNRYGTPRGPVEEQRAAGRPVLLEIEVQGARQVRERVPGALLVFLAPPSWEVLQARLTGRGTESTEAVERRLAAAREELAAAGEFDVTLVNADVQQCAEALVAWAVVPDPAAGGGSPASE